MSDSERARLRQLAADLEYELSAFDSVVADARRCLGDLADRAPTYLELRGAGDIVHDYYNAVEHFFERVALELDGGLPAGRDWHSTLLSRMARELPDVRPALVSDQSRSALEELLRFRHLFRHRYGFDLEWSKLMPLLVQARDRADALRSELSRFVATLARLANELGD
jgi:HepT-like protein